MGDQVILRKNDYCHLAVRNGDRGIVTNLQMAASRARIQTDVYIDRTTTATQSLLRVAENLDQPGDKPLPMDTRYSLHRE